ncbi:MAG: succinate dehydrogenase/fumarate reductase iron-sulfur subunit, partial [Acidobacteria bacterium]|nr:succinate dehydrogenase/fumarate reductase iron-sulfur subunit [Acidobacteriota bacterium]
LQDHGVHQGIEVYMEVTVVALLKDGDRVVGAFAYEREHGRFRIFKAKAVILATGGIGRAYKITSNSWEGTGDGHSLAFDAGAELIDMEFIQFHPTGMVYPPSVRGILVTEGVRGEGGILKNSEGRRFMFDDIPDNYKDQTADTPEEGWRYTQGDKNARRPPELLTRDHVARCIVREVKAGRGTPNGGVYLDIAWIKEKISKAPEHIKKKLPSMYHQFKQLADLDITEQPMEVGPTTHYIMGGIRVDADTQASTVPGLFAAGECAAGINGANRLGGNSLSDLLVFGKRAGEYAAKFAQENDFGQINNEQIEESAYWSLEAFDRTNGENPFQIQHDLQDMMQDLVGIVRNENEMQRALIGIEKLKERREKISLTGNIDFNPSWHTALDLHNLLNVSEAITLAAIERKESRGGQFREDYPAKVASNKMAKATFKIWRGDKSGGELQSYQTEISEGMVVLDAVLQIQGEQAGDLACRWNCKAGKCGSCSAEINGNPKLMCMTRLNTLPLENPVTVEPMKAFPLKKDLVTDVSWNYEVKKRIKKFKPRPPDAPAGTWRMFQEDIDRVQEFRKCIECYLCQDVCHVLRDHEMHEQFIGPRFLVYAAALEMHPLDTEDRLQDLKDESNIGLCNITKCCTKICPENITITDNAIIPLKERVVDEFYDPIKKFLRLFRRSPKKDNE